LGDKKISASGEEERGSIKVEIGQIWGKEFSEKFLWSNLGIYKLDRVEWRSYRLL
jgi:hypothetical protein